MKTRNPAKKVLALILLLSCLSFIPSSLAHPLPATIYINGRSYCIVDYTAKPTEGWHYDNDSRHKRNWGADYRDQYDYTYYHAYEYQSHMVDARRLSQTTYPSTEKKNNKIVNVIIHEETWFCHICKHTFKRVRKDYL